MLAVNSLLLLHLGASNGEHTWRGRGTPEAEVEQPGGITTTPLITAAGVSYPVGSTSQEIQLT